jgi:hypothetical protein
LSDEIPLLAVYNAKEQGQADEAEKVECVKEAQSQCPEHITPPEFGFSRRGLPVMV